MSRPVDRLRNLGPKSVEWLAAIGIHTAEDLIEVGYAAAYQELIATGTARPHRMLLYALAGAVMDRDCMGFTRDEKREIEEMAGLR